MQVEHKVNNFMTKTSKDVVKSSLHVEECVNEGQKFSLHAQLLLEEVRTVGGSAWWCTIECCLARPSCWWWTSNVCVSELAANERRSAWINYFEKWFSYRSISNSSSFCVSTSFCWTAKRRSWFNVFFSSSAAVSWFVKSSHWVTYSSHLAANIARRPGKLIYSQKVEQPEELKTLLENVAASDFSILNSFLKLHIVSLTTSFSFSYFDLRLLSATSAVFLFDLSTVRRVAICSRLVDNNDLSLMICSWRSAISSLDSLSAAKKWNVQECRLKRLRWSSCSYHLNFQESYPCWAQSRVLPLSSNT